MAIDVAELNRMQSEYKTSVEAWIASIREEETLASANHNEAEIDQWNAADSREEQARARTKSAKRAYEDALRQEFFNF